MRFPLLSSLGVLFALATHGSAQTIRTDEVVLLDSLVPPGGGADHITTAINSRGDVLATWSSSLESLDAPNSVLRRVEAQFFLRTGKVKWITGARVTLGDGIYPNGGPVFPLGDLSRKPDVVAVGQNFIVAWTRLEDGQDGNGRLESAFVEIPNAPSDAIYHTPSPGFGYPITYANARLGGLMPDLATHPSLGDNTAVVVFAPLNEVWQTGYGNAYDFDLVGCVIDYSQGGSPQVSTPQVLESRIGFDPFPNGSGGNQDISPGGKILPDCVFDSQGKFVVAYEEFRRRYVFVPPADEDYSRIHIRRYDINTGVFAVVNSFSVYGNTSSFPQRRPNLRRSPTNTLVSLAWGEIEPVNNIGDVKWLELDFLSNPPQIIEENLPYTPVANETLPVPFQYKTTRGLIMSLDISPYGRLMPYRLKGSSIWRRTPVLTPFQPWRAAPDVLEDDTANGRPGRGLMVLGFEGRVNNQLRTLLLIHGL